MVADPSAGPGFHAQQKAGTPNMIPEADLLWPRSSQVCKVYIATASSMVAVSSLPLMARNICAVSRALSDTWPINSRAPVGPLIHVWVHV